MNFYEYNVFDISEKMQLVLEYMQQTKSPDIRYFSKSLKEYDERGVFKLVKKNSIGHVYEGNIPNRKICGGDIALIKIHNSPVSNIITIQNKNNKDNFYELVFDLIKKEGMLKIESQRYLKTIYLKLSKKLFGYKVDVTKEEIESFNDLGC